MVTILVGFCSGIAGMLLALLLHLVQHIAFGYGLQGGGSHESFLSGVSHADPARRVAVLAVCAVVAGGGWWAVYAIGRPLVSVRQATKPSGAAMPLATVGHALLQIVTVGLGSPLGREVAPREMGALLGGALARAAGLNAEEARVLIACGAGAGLAAVYNVPLGGALFTLEVLLQTVSPSAALPALTTSVIAAFVAWAGLGNQSQYRLEGNTGLSASLLCWSVLAGPALGFAGGLYARLAAAARARAPRDWRLLPFCGAAFLAVGAASTVFPQVLGNGRGPIQASLDGGIGPGLAATLLLLKLSATTACLRSGAKGGMLTPGMTIGALLAVLSGAAWNVVWPGTQPAVLAVVGAAAFLAASMEMPLTAVVLIMEFTRAGHDLLIPVVISVAGASAAVRFTKQ